MAQINVLNSGFVPPNDPDNLVLFDSELSVTRDIYRVSATVSGLTLGDGTPVGALVYEFAAAAPGGFTGGNGTIPLGGAIGSISVYAGTVQGNGTVARGQELYNITDPDIGIDELFAPPADPDDPRPIDRLIFMGEDTLSVTGITLDAAWLELARFDGQRDTAAGSAAGTETLRLGTAALPIDPDDVLGLPADLADPGGDFELFLRGESVALGRFLDFDLIEFVGGETFTVDAFLARPPVALDDSAGPVDAGASTANLHALLLANDTSFVFDPADPDAGAIDITAIASQPMRGTVTFDDAADTLVYTATAEDFADLADGEAAFETFSYTVSDGVLTDTATVTVTVIGGNSTPVILATSELTGAAAELPEGDPEEDLAPVSASGTIFFSDADTDDSFTVGFVSAVPSLADNFSLGPVVQGGDPTIRSVDWSFSGTDADLDFLAEGEILPAVFTVTVTDAGGASANAGVTISLTGANDTPALLEGSDLAGTVPNAVDPVFSDTGDILFLDDLIDTHTITATPAGEGFLGSFVLDDAVLTDDLGARSLAWTFTAPEADIAALDLPVVQAYDITVADQLGAAFETTVTVTLAPVLGDPVISVADIAVDEAAGTATFTILRAGSSEEDITLDVTTTDGTADGGVVGQSVPFDYVNIAELITIPASDAAVETVEVVVAIEDDDENEGDETFTLDVTVTAGTVGNDPETPIFATATIIDDDQDFALAAVNGTYLRVDPEFDEAAAPTVVDLAALGFGPGDSLALNAVGDFSFGPGEPEAPFDLLGVFSSDGVVLEDQTLLARVPGAIDAGEDVISLATDPGGLPTDIPEDFLIPAGDAPLTIEIPEGAGFLILSANDGFFSDNTDAEPNFGVEIGAVPGDRPEISVADDLVFEAPVIGGTSVVEFVVTRTGPSSEDIVLRASTEDGLDDGSLSALSSLVPGTQEFIVDFVALEDFEFTIPASDAEIEEVVVEVTVNQDEISPEVPDPETFRLVLELVSGDAEITDGEAIGSIRDTALAGDPFLVTTLDDNMDAGGGTTLREAIAALNASEGGGVIRFDAALAGGTIALDEALGELVISADGTIDGDSDGDGLRDITVSGGGSTRVMSTSAEDVTLTLANITIADGFTGGFDENGAGVFAAGDLVLDNAAIAGNRTEGDEADGAGVFAIGALEVTDSLIAGNSTAGDDAFGAGLFSFGDMTLVDTDVVDNATTGDIAKGAGLAAEAGLSITGGSVSRNTTTGVSSEGAGICVHGDAVLLDVTIADNVTSGDSAHGGGIAALGAVDITGGTVSGNSTPNIGGGIFNNGGVTTISGTTLTGNSAGTFGGAIADGIDGQGAVIDGATISGNSAALDGGGLDVLSATITNSTIADNEAGTNGGGVWAEGGSLVNVTLHGNRAGLAGGAVYVGDSDRPTFVGEMLLQNVTVTGNEALDGEIIDGDSAVSFIDLISTIILGNVADTVFTDIVFSEGDNIIGDELLRFDMVLDSGISEADVFASVGTVNGTTAGLLASNGGAVQTVALRAAADNPAVDATILLPSETTDARGTGFARDIDIVGLNDSLGAVQVDLGAFEIQDQFEIPEIEMEFLLDAVDPARDVDGGLDDWGGLAEITATIEGVGDTVLDITPIDVDESFFIEADEAAEAVVTAFEDLGITVSSTISDRSLASSGPDSFTEIAAMEFGDSFILTFPDGEVTDIVMGPDSSFEFDTYGALKLGGGLPGIAVFAGLAPETHQGFANGGALDAGPGFDTVVYALPRAALDLSLGAGGTITVAGPEGQGETLDGVERVLVDDGAWLFDLAPEAASVHRLYGAAFGRTADETGLRFWDGQREAGTALDDIAEAFVESDEFAADFGGEAPSTEDFVDALYLNLFGRAADEDGETFWEAAFADGATRAEMLLAFSESEENIELTADDTDDGFWVVV
ncbi:hypothetical protein LNKW23_09340 [Paralimibaculum aggregatum]|uniref:DUF4214 domain-containing protein n=1 Tax=Paralimibaculum aggregatum TaxID=3036245 RepID=A0ABQ6LEF2_9RHOB|nr:DUF4214 domain-containing protein [Limibaculum sp. NKW23]GMG81721.1 hypothetical protein LNKW23_09340 [Limibaculum sp. NKW23]